MIRIIGGQLKRRRIFTPPDAETTRPMPDRVRQALFNLLRGHAEGVDVFDGFAGSGALGFEAISRGARHVVFVERERRVAALIEQTARELNIEDRCEIATGDALGAGALARCPEGVHLVFFDPPYPLVRERAQWPRVRDQFGRLIGKLDETGYAMIRTPWPCVHEIASEKTDDEVEPNTHSRAHNRKHGTHRKGKDGMLRVDALGHDLHELDEMAQMIELDEAQRQAFEMEADGERDLDAGASVIHESTKIKQARKVVAVDMKIPGAIGPETHAYGTTAIHLYMRDPAFSDGPDARPIGNDSD